MPVKIENSFSPMSPIGEALNSAITTYTNSIPTWGEVQQGRVNQNKADQPNAIGEAVRSLYAAAGPGQKLTPQQVQDTLPQIVQTLSMGGNLSETGNMIRALVANAANPESVQMIDRAQQGAGQAYNTTETGTNNAEANDIKQMQMQQAGANYRTKLTVDAANKRAEEALKAKGAAGAKPLPVGALRMQQEALDAIGTGNNITNDLGTIKDQVDNGDLELGPLTNAGSAVRNFVGLSSENSRNYGTFKATLEKLRNDSLRLNKGVQTEGDAVRAWNELLANINDPDFVSQRLEEIQNINDRAVELRKADVSTLRGNYGLDPLNIDAYDQGSALGGEGGGGEAPAANSSGITIKRVR